MKNIEVQILFHVNSNLSDYSVSVNYPDVELKEVKKVENPHYLFITLSISSVAKAGNVPFTFTSGKKSNSGFYTEELMGYLEEEKLNQMLYTFLIFLLNNQGLKLNCSAVNVSQNSSFLKIICLTNVCDYDSDKK